MEILGHRKASVEIWACTYSNSTIDEKHRPEILEAIPGSVLSLQVVVRQSYGLGSYFCDCSDRSTVSGSQRCNTFNIIMFVVS